MRLRSIIRNNKLPKTTQFRFLNTDSERKFLDTIKFGHVDEVKYSLETSSGLSLLKARYKGNDKDVNRGNFALHVAFEYGHLGIASTLLECALKNNLAILSDLNSIGVPPWVYALLYFNKRNFVERSRSLEEKKTLRNIIDANEFRSSFAKCPTLLKFVKTLYTSDDKSIIECASDPEIITEKGPYGFNALHYSVAHDSLVGVQSLLKNPALNPKKTLEFIKSEDCNGNNLLHIAVENVSENSQLVSELLLSLKDSAKSENAQKDSVISERFELKNFLRKPNNYGYDPFYLALTTGSVRNFSKIFFNYGYNIHEPAYIVYDELNMMNRVFQVPSTLIAFKWLKGDDNKIKRVIEWLFRHGADLDNMISLDTLGKLGMDDAAKQLTQGNLSNHNRLMKCTLVDIAEYYGYINTRDFLLKNGAGYSDQSKNIEYQQENQKQELSTESQSSDSNFPLSQGTEDELKGLNGSREISENKSNQNISSGHTIFSLAIVHGNYVLVEQFLSANPEMLSICVTLKFDGRLESSKNSPLHLAVRYGKDKGGLRFYQDKEHNQCALLEILLSKHSAWYKSHLSIKVLLNENDKKLTPLNLAARNGYIFGVNAITKCYLEKISEFRVGDNLPDNENFNLLVNDIRKSLNLAKKFHRYAIQYCLIEALSNLGVIASINGRKFCIDDDYALIASAVKYDMSSAEPIFDSLVFQGGGVRGISHVGAIQQFEEEVNEIVNLKKIKYVGGTSVGAIIASLFAAGYESSELRGIIIESLKLPTLLEDSQQHYSEFESLYQKYHHDPAKLNALKESVNTIFTKLKSFYEDNKAELERVPYWFNNAKWYNDIIAKIRFGFSLKALYNELSQIIKSVDVTKEDLRKLMRLSVILYIEKGVFSGDKLRDIIEQHMRDKTGIEHITFEEQHLLASVKTEVKDVSLVVVDTMRKKTHVLSYLNDPHHIVSDGALSSGSVPLFFKPHERYVKPPGRKRALDITDDGALYVDGGLNDNYPEWLFKDVSQNTLGIRLLKPSLWSKYSTGLFTVDKKSENFFQFAFSLIGSIRSKQESDFDIKCNPLNTILINTQTVDTLDFNASDEDKKKLIDAGREAVKAYLGTQSSILLKNKTVNGQSKKINVPNFSRFFKPTCYCGKSENCPSEQDEPKNSSRLT
ncbi:MAG: patatin-like phospholipase family protein [Gammaproteobacteria bacterium]|nr:patatin-like phospholipase family protein [Gammaproteobacteria bacterium]